MPKIFITERDIDDMKARGITSIEMTDNTVITDLAVERAFKHGIILKRVEQSAPPEAVFRPSANPVTTSPYNSPSDAELIQKIKSLVLVKLDGQVDTALLDAVVARVIAAIK